MRETQVRNEQQSRWANLFSNRVFLCFVAAYLLFAAGALRTIAEFEETPYRLYVHVLLGAYLLLLSTERVISQRWSGYQWIYYSLQVLVILGLSRARPIYDFYAILFLGLCIQVIWFSSQRAAIFWIAVFTIAVTASEINLFGWGEGISYSITYIASGFFVSVLGVTTLRAERAQAESQVLLVELRAANRRLREYADQVQELATVQERNRLARELHDSVTQTIFSITLTAQSALILLDRDPGRVKEQLLHLQALSKSALAEMRALIQQLHPQTVGEKGLIAALQYLVRERKEKHGLAVSVEVLCPPDEPAPRLPAEVEESLYRVIQEALNNVVKHARTDQASVTLDFRANPACVTIEDKGVGFDPRKTGSMPGHLGLTSMEERVQAFGGRLTVESQPGAGTRVRIDGLRMEERTHA